MSIVVVPDGFRLLKRGERIRKGDIYMYCRGSGQSWHQSRLYGKTWNPEENWPMARRCNRGSERTSGKGEI
jgi:hypothetical protein